MKSRRSAGKRRIQRHIAITGTDDAEQRGNKILVALAEAGRHARRPRRPAERSAAAIWLARAPTSAIRHLPLTGADRNLAPECAAICAAISWSTRASRGYGRRGLVERAAAGRTIGGGQQREARRGARGSRRSAREQLSRTRPSSARSSLGQTGRVVLALEAHAAIGFLDGVHEQLEGLGTTRVRGAIDRCRPGMDRASEASAWSMLNTTLISGNRLGIARDRQRREHAAERAVLVLVHIEQRGLTCRHERH